MWVVALSVVVIAGAGVFMYIQNSVPKLVKDKFDFEYGEKIEIDKKELLDTKDEKIIDSIKLDLSKVKMEDKKAYPSVGKYKVEVKYNTGFKDITDTVEVNVKDTTKPEFKKIENEVKVSVGDTDFDFYKLFKASDLSKTEIKFNFDDVDFNKAGKYDAKVSVQDAYKNKLEKTFKVIVEKVKEKEPEEIEDTEKPVNKPSKPQDTSPTYVNGILVVNKKHYFGAAYETGEDPTAGAMARQMIADMQAQGLDISSNYSGYRSYSYQDGLYWSYVNSYGQAQADTFSARAGHSEHQTGLAFDLLHSNGALVENTAEANWIASNAHNYGFIVRYKAGKEHITGYQAEPWHIRYVGDVATSIYQSRLTLEEYLGVEGGDYY